MIEVHKVAIPPILPALLDSLHKQGKEVETIRGGTQINLRGAHYKALNTLMRSILEIHAGEFTGLWSCRMEKGGYHVMHNHPDGRISGVCYVQVPDQSSGRLKFEDRELTPEAGMVVFFPSSTPHGTTVYEGEKPRMTVAFDFK